MDPARLMRVLRQHVETDRLLGIEEVYRSPRTPVVATSTPMATPGPGPGPTDLHPRLPALAPAAAVPEPGTREQKLRLLVTMDEMEVRGCTRCELCQSRTQTVFGEGDPDAAIMFIGEGPGQTEDEMGRPFVGKSGELLDKMIVAMGFSRDTVYIANVVKCRPPGNRTPTPAEAATCSTYLQRQIAWVRPRAIVTLGGPAAKLILNTSEGITRIRGQWRSYDALDPPIPVMPTFHPAFLLRSYTKDNREKVWSDLQGVMERIKPRVE